MKPQDKELKEQVYFLNVRLQNYETLIKLLRAEIIELKDELGKKTENDSKIIQMLPL